MCKPHKPSAKDACNKLHQPRRENSREYIN